MLRRLFSKLKPSGETRKSTNIVYKINCGYREGTYISETKQLLYKNMAQNKNSIRNNNTNATALLKHPLEFQHKYDYSNIKILETGNNFWKRVNIWNASY